MENLFMGQGENLGQLTIFYDLIKMEYEKKSILDQIASKVIQK
jgi:hypothetical protein